MLISNLTKFVFPFIEDPNTAIFESNKSTLKGGCICIIGMSYCPKVQTILSVIISHTSILFHPVLQILVDL